MRSILVLTLATLAETSLANGPPADLCDVWESWERDVADSLSSSAAPRDWILAASSEFGPDLGERRRNDLAQRAVAAAPDDALVQWIVVNGFYDRRIQEAALTNLLRHEP